MTREERYKKYSTEKSNIIKDDNNKKVKDKKVVKRSNKKVVNKSKGDKEIKNVTKVVTKKRRLKKKYVNIILLISVIMIIFGSFKLINLQFDSNKIKDTEKKIENVIKEIEVEDTSTTVVVKNEEKEESLFWKYIKTPLVDVNVHELKQSNADTRGWIKVGGTNINVPFTHASDNEYYLSHDFEKKYNEFGWVFADYRNKVDLTDKNLIIYGHNTADTSMFGTLRHVITKDWLNNTDNHIINMSLENVNTLWQVVSVYKINNTSDYIKTDFNDNNYNEFLNLITSRSIYNFNASVTSTDKILTLSTCSNNDTRIVLHAKLIKYDNKN